MTDHSIEAHFTVNGSMGLGGVDEAVVTAIARAAVMPPGAEPSVNDMAVALAFYRMMEAWWHTRIQPS